MPATYLRKPALGAYQPGDQGECVTCGRRRSGLCSAGCRMEARRVLPPRKRVRRPEPIRPACDVADLAAKTKHLIALGKAVHGKHWMRPTAHDVGVTIKTIWRWKCGQSQPTAEHLEWLLAAAKQQSDAISAAYRPALKQWHACLGPQYADQRTYAVLPARNEIAQQNNRPFKAWWERSRT
jgi:transcriptional regulator with XRE-family HTH domain